MREVCVRLGGRGKRATIRWNLTGSTMMELSWWHDALLRTLIKTDGCSANPCILGYLIKELVSLLGVA